MDALNRPPKAATQPSISYLIHRIAVRLENSINSKARKYRLRIGEIRVLMRLLDHGDLPVGDLAQITSIAPSALSHLLQRLDSDGWITRARKRKDSRIVLVSLTQTGRNFAKMLQPYVSEYNDAAVQGIKPAEQAILRNLLEIIYHNIVRLE